MGAWLLNLANFDLIITSLDEISRNRDWESRTKWLWRNYKQTLAYNCALHYWVIRGDLPHPFSLFIKTSTFYKEKSPIICVYTHICAYARRNAHTHMRTITHTQPRSYMHACRHKCMYTRINARIHARMRAHTHALWHSSMHTYTRACIHTRTRTRMHTCRQEHIHAHTRRCMCRRMRRCAHTPAHVCTLTFAYTPTRAHRVKVPVTDPLR